MAVRFFQNSVCNSDQNTSALKKHSLFWIIFQDPDQCSYGNGSGELGACGDVMRCMRRGCKGPFGLKNSLDFQRRAAATVAASAADGAAANPAAAAAANADPLPDWNVLTPALADFNSFSLTRALPPLLQPGTPKV